ncbi:MAG TPA: tetratricopeptide repeat protein, partial [Lacunisphaera sp.]
MKRKRTDGSSRPAQAATPAVAAPPVNIGVTLLKAAILLALGIYIYYPSLYGLYLWDDDFLIQNNPVVHDPQGIWYIWSDPEHALIDFFPLTVSVEWLIWQIFYDPTVHDPQFVQMTFYFHITSLILHLIDGLMIWYLFRKMGIRLAYLGALIFVVHPVLVESVSWMAELKNTIAMPTFILAVVAWLNFERTRNLWYYVASFVLYVISMLTKTSGVMFPVIILLYDWWKNPETNFVSLFFQEAEASFRAVLALFNFGPGYFRRFWNEVSHLRWTYVPTIPFFIVAVADAYYLILYLRHGVGEQFIPGLLGGPIGRTACAGLSLIFYFSKCVLPYNLLPIYPQWEVNNPSFSLEYILKFLPWPVMAFGFWWLWKRSAQPWARAAFFGFGFFFLNLLPFVGWRAISFMRFGWVMDHFLYVPILGLIGLAAAAAGDLYDRIPRTAGALRIAAVSAAVALVAVFTFGSHLYAGDFVDRLTYWTYECQHNWVAWPAHNNRGNQLLDNATVAERKGYLAEAAAMFAESKKEFQIALMLNPVYTEAHNNLGYILTREGHYAEAEAEFRTALSYTPDFESAQMNLAHVLQLENAQMHNQRGVDLANKGEYKAAEAEFRQAVQLTPESQQAQQNLSHVLELEAVAAP